MVNRQAMHRQDVHRQGVHRQAVHRCRQTLDTVSSEEK